jgi:hypothetical protein
MERRALRHAADQALITSLGNGAGEWDGGAPDQDFQYTWSGPVEVAALHDHEPVTEPIPVAGNGAAEPDGPDEFGLDGVETTPDDDGRPSDVQDVYALVPLDPNEPAMTAPPIDDVWGRQDAVPPPAPAPDQPALRGEPVVSSPYVRPDLDVAVSGYRGRTPRYTTRPAAAVLVAAAIAAVVCGGWLLVRDPAVAVEQSSTESPRSAPPVPSKAPQVAVSALKPPPAPAPPPLPPPPLAAPPTYSAPQRQYSPRYSESTPAQKPRVDVTRAPISVAPVPRPVPGSDSNTPGDAHDRDHPRRRGCFGFC